jgi:probable HAF family extracellular repeat protein
MNNKGEVDGISTLPGDQNTHAFLWRDGVMIDLGTLGGPNSNGDTGSQFGPNASSEVVGFAETSIPDPLGEDFCFLGHPLTCLPFIWRNGVLSPLPTLGGFNGFASGINNRGQVVGTAENMTPEPNCFNQLQKTKPVIWEKGEIHELPTFPGDTDGVGVAINDLGQAIGTSGGCQSGPNFALHGLLWEKGGLTDLGNLGGHTFTFPEDINNQGQIVGSSDLPGDSFPGHAFLWTKESGIQNLGTLPGDVSSLAKGINDKGQVVGQSTDANGNSRAFLWQNGTMIDLNTLVPGGGSTFFMFEAFAINPRGQFVAVAFDANTGDCCAFLATPSNGESGNGNSISVGQDSSLGRSQVALPENIRKLLQRGMRFGQPIGESQNTDLRANAAISAPKVSLSPSTLTFPTQLLGTKSPAKIVTLKNIGNASLTNLTFAITGNNVGDFVQTHTCGSSLTAGASCSISVTFTPTAPGSRTGALSVMDNASGSPQIIPLSGIGAASTTAQLIPSSMRFVCDTHFPGGCKAKNLMRTATLTNTGSNTLVISSITISFLNVGFSETNDCPKNVSPGKSCTITVTYHPEQISTGHVFVNDNVIGSPQTISLSGDVF